MQQDLTALVSGVRAASRDLVRELGFLNRTVAGTDLSASAVHALIEIGRAGALTARDLAERLLLEKSTVSRLVGALIERGEISEERSTEDRRVKLLRLTPMGRATLSGINAFAEGRVSGALSGVAVRECEVILRGLEAYATALQAAAGHRAWTRPEPRVEKGYAPTLLARVVELLGVSITSRYPFGRAFETRIAADMAQFLQRIDSPRNETWRAEVEGRIVGGISIDGEDLGDRLAHLRWFVVQDGMRGAGIGRLLLREALSFCDERAYREIHLWTLKGLDAARALYERHGFRLVEEWQGDQWGATVTEQQFVRPLGG